MQCNREKRGPNAIPSPYSLTRVKKGKGRGGVRVHTLTACLDFTFRGF